MEGTHIWTCGHECWTESVEGLYSLDEKMWYCERCMAYAKRMASA